MANIQERIGPTGKKSYRVAIRKKGFLPIYKSFSTLEEAQKYADFIENSIDKKSTVMNLPLSVYIKRYKEEKGYNTENSKCNNMYLYNFWDQRLGSKIATEITIQDIESAIYFVSQEKTKYGTVNSPETIRKHAVALSSVYNMAIKIWKWCDINPVSKINPIYKSYTHARPRCRADGEFITFFKEDLRQAMEDRRLENETTYAFSKRLGTHKSTYNKFFTKDGGTSVNQLLNCLNKIGLTLQVVPSDIANPLQDNES